MKRIDVLNQITEIRDDHCNICSIPSDILRQHPGHLAKADNHCNKVCEQGAMLQELGKQLTLPPRKGVAVAG
ncbi:zinc-finger domain-containing protein [Paenibacillus sp. FSL L8-0340]|uniref:zinc-finger domain-containing protein n=1 Tax=Paenibacillus sp. FSL L8-0340 TaxID=2954685 RepID=UPI0031587415